MELTTDQKGAIAETALVHAAARLCIPVYAPAWEGGRYDLIFASANASSGPEISSLSGYTGRALGP